jgi:hypothetical protein
MSVDSVDRSNQMDYRKQSDEHETELAARHRKELAEISKRHQKDIEKIRKEYSDAMSDLRHGTSEALSDRDRRHMKDVQDIQEMNRKRLTQVRGDDEEKFDRTKDNLEGEVSRTKAKDDYDQKRLTKAFDSAMAKKSEEESDLEENYRESGKEAYDTQGKRLNDKDEKDKEFLWDQIHDNRSKSDRELSETRKDRDAKIANLKMRMEDQRMALSERYKDDVRREQQRYDGHLQNMRDGFAEEMGQNKDKFRNRAEDLSDEYRKNYNQLKDSTNNRVDKEVDSVRRENQTLQDKVVMTKEKDKIQNSIENDHLIGEYQNREDELEFRREKSADLAHREKSKDLYNMQKNHDRFTEKRTQDFANKYNDLKLQSETNLDQKVGQAYRDRDLNKIQTDLQKKRVVENYADKTNEQAEFYDDAIGGKEQNYQKLLSEQRAVAERAKNEDVGTLQNQLAKENVAHQEKLVDTVSSYEKDINQMRNDYEKKIRHQADLFREQTDKQVKAMQVDREASEAKLQARLGQTKEFYEKELDQLRKRQVVERQELAMKKNS